MGAYGSPELYPYENNSNSENMAQHGKLLGFRSGKLWKKIFSVLYLFVLAIMLLVVIFGRNTALSKNDIIVNNLQSLVVIAFLGSPYIFLSDYKLRDNCPLFKNKNFISNFIGFVILFFLYLSVFMFISDFYSDEYKQQLEAKQTAQTNIENLPQNDEIQQDNKTQNADEDIFATQEDYKKACESFSYEEISRYPNAYKGKLAKYTGKVVQTQDRRGTTWFRLSVTKGEYDIWDDTIFVEFKYDNTVNTRILEDDIVTVYGEMAGIKTYTAILGNEVQIPYLKAKYVRID